MMESLSSGTFFFSFLLLLLLLYSHSITALLSAAGLALLFTLAWKAVFVRRLLIPANSAVLITGTSSGIGKEAALSLADRGFFVFACVRKEEDGAALVSECKKPSHVIPVVMDICDAVQVRNAAAVVERRIAAGGLRLLGIVNNAGYGETSIMELISLEKVKAQFEVNVFGHVAVTQAFLPLLRKGNTKSHTGRVVFVTSGAGRMTIATMGTYCASKHALESLADAFRMELKIWGLDVAVIEPGFIRTNFQAVSDARLRENIELALLERNEVLEPHVAEEYERRLRPLKKEQEAITNLLATPIAAVVGKIEAALLDSRPSTRYRAGLDAQFLPLFTKLPDRALDFLLGRSFHF